MILHRRVVFASHDGGGSWKSIKKDGDNAFVWSFTPDTTQQTNGTWSIQYTNAKWTSDNALVWEKGAIDR